MFSKFNFFFQSRIDFTNPEYCKKFMFTLYVLISLSYKKNVTIFFYDVIDVRGLSKKFVEFVNKNKTTVPIAFKFVYN